MKTYMGIPSDPPTISVTDDRAGTTAPLEGGPFGWGRISKPVGPAMQPPEAKAAALAILMDHMGPSGRHRAPGLALRFQYRVIAELKHGMGWVLTGADIDQHLQAIEDAAAETRQGVAAAARAPDPVAFDGIRGIDLDTGKPNPGIIEKG